MRLGNIWKSLLNDECGLVLSSEAALVGTVGVLGAAVGLSAIGQSVNDELKELAFAFRSLDQSYSIAPIKGCGGWTAGSEFIQQDVEKSLEELCDALEDAEERAKDDDHDDHDRKKKRDSDDDDDREEMKRKGQDEKKKSEERRKRDSERDDD